MAKSTYRGIVKGGTIVVEEAADLPEGTEVLVTSLDARRGSPQAVLRAMEDQPHVTPEDVDELMRLIQEGKRPVRYQNPFTPKRKR